MVKRGFHVQVYRLFCLILGPLLRAVFQYQGRVLRQIPAPAIIVANHNTDIDPILLGLSFPRHSYFVASEHIFRWGPVSWLLRLLFAPIIRAKGGANTQTVMEILGTLREGYNVSIFAEGNRSFSGVTGPVLPATGKLVRASGAHLVTFRFRGGYFASPRWGRRMRKGPIRGELVGVYSPEQLSTMKAAEITGLIQRDIHEDAYESQARDPRAYRSRAPAEDLETGLYLCPECGRMGALSSRASRLYCSCGLEYRYDEYGALQRLKGPSNGGGGGSFTRVRDWWFWQEAAMEGLVAAAGQAGTVSTEVCADEGEALYEIDRGRRARFVCRGRLSLGRDGLRCGDRRFPLRDIADLAMTGQRTLVFSAGGKSWELKNPRPRSAAKYQRAFDLLKRP